MKLQEVTGGGDDDGTSFSVFGGLKVRAGLLCGPRGVAGSAHGGGGQPVLVLRSHSHLLRMKVAIPGRAMKMEELPHGAHLTPILKPAKIPFNNIEIRPPIDYLSLKADAEGGARGLDSTSLLPLPSTSNNNNNNNTNINTKGWKKTARLYRKELKAKGNIRPSTAVRRHVKKISEEFTLTQVKYENAVSTEGKDKNQGRSSSSSSSSAANNNKTLAKNVSSKITCTKCESASKPSSKTMEGRVFSIFGYFPAIRDALRRRGWVEKMQHNVPYLNPHPNNCVCPHVGYQASFLSPAPAHHAHASYQSTATPQNPPTLAVPAAAKSVKQEEEKGEEEAAKDEGVKESAEENESCTTTTTTPGTPPPASQPCTNSSSLPSPPSPPLPPTAPPSCSPPPPPSPASTPLPVSPSPPTSPPSSATPSSSSSSSVESEDLKAATTATPGSSSIDEVVPARTIHPPPQDSLAGHSDERTASVTPDAEESSNTVEGSSAASQETAAQKAVDRINTAILGPSEVRRGLAESITERNATIYKYNTKHVPVKRAPRPIPAHKEEPIPEGTKGDEATQHAEEQGEAETTREEEEEAPAENEEQQEEQTKERVPTPEPYNPYVDFVVSDVDMPLVARLLRNVEPNLLWTWTRDSISFKHLSREQVVNRFPNTPFTTKQLTLCTVYRVATAEIDQTNPR
ncbi:hypothetical protein E2C01_013900 [Portunus trituberculatus]|uniref:Uncharacterized protein n=1 Tax=Portunus trituberculatus TaxID=210409 RepID=A0A5B7DIC4_PORTR|nr:hypothetical protein [Portunus trituberculatus]